MKIKFSLILFMFLLFAKAQNITIVASGGSPENSGWSYSSGILSVTGSVSINASDVVAKLSLGSLTIQTNGQINISSSITSNTSSSLTFKTASNILQSPNANISTAGGSVIYWADSDASGQGAICIGDSTGGASVLTSGGNITLSGGTSIASGYAASATGFLPWGAKPISGISVFNSTLDAQGGNIVVRGALNSQIGNVSGRAVILTTSIVKTSSFGTIAIDGTAGNFAGTNPWGVIIEGYSVIETFSGNLDISGTGSNASGNSRGVVISGGSLTNQRPFINAKGGATITITDKTNSNSANFNGTYLNMAYIGQTLSTPDANYGSGRVNLISDKFQFGGGSVRANFTQINTNGEIYIQPFTNSFRVNSSDASIPQIFEILAFGNPSYVQIGKSTNTSPVFIGGTSWNISFNHLELLDIYAGNITFNRTITGEKLRLFSSGSVSQLTSAPLNFWFLETYGSGSTSLNNTSNQFRVLTAGTTSTPVGNLNIVTTEDLLISDSDLSGLIGINSTGTIVVRTYNGADIDIDRTIKTTNNTNSAILIQADFGMNANAACDASASGGKVYFGRTEANIDIPASGRARIFSSSPSASTYLNTKAIGGVFYRINTGNQLVSGLPNSGVIALYRADNVVPIGGLSSISGDRNLASEATEATYSVLPVSGATSYVWALPSGLTLISQTGPSITVGVSSTFTSGSISVYAMNGCSQTSVRTISVRKSEVPVGGVSFTVSGSPVLCSNATGVYTATSLTGGSYVWEVPNGITITSGQGSNEINVSSDSNFTSGVIRAKFITSSYTLDGSYTVSGVTQPSVMSGPIDLCGLTTATYSVTQVSGVSYVWSVPSGMTIIGSSDSSSIAVSITGVVSGNVSVRAQNACGLSTARSLFVKSTPIMGWISGATRVCGAVQATVDTTGAIIDNTPSDTYTYSVVASAGVSYFWTVPSAATIVSGQNTNSITVRYDLANFDSGSITVQGTNSCGVGSPRSLAVSAVTGSISGPTSLCSLTTATYSVPSDLGTIFTWSLPEGMSISSGQGTSSITVSITHPIKFNTDNRVRVQFTTGCGGTRILSLGVSCSDYTNLTSDYCGATSIDPYQWIYATEISTASEYRFNVYDATGSTLLFTVNRNVPYFRFFGNSFTYGGTYQVKVQVKPRLGVFGVEGSSCNVTLQNVPTTALQATHCGSSVNPYQWLYASQVAGASGYRFTIYDATGTDLLFTIDSSVSYFRFLGSAFSYGSTYQVRVQAKQGEVYGTEGSSCSITLSGIPTTSINATHCGSTVTPYQWMFASQVAGATEYRFNIYDSTGTNLLFSIDRNVAYFRFFGSSFIAGTTYSVGVQAKQGGVYSTEGSRCSITLSGPPTTSIANAQCGATVLYTDAIYATAVTNATGYKFNVYDVTGTTLVASTETATASFSFSQLTGYTFDTTYQVRVQVIRGSEYGVEGSPCTITVIKEEPTRVVSNNGVTKTRIVSELTAYPNPFTTTFSITPIEGETATLFYQVYDVTGKMIESRSVEVSEITNHAIGEYYPVGMYLVMVRQGATTQTLKMVKQ